MLKTELIKLYFYVCEIYEKELRWHCERFTKCPVSLSFTDEELITSYLFTMSYENKTQVKDVYNYLVRHWSDWFPSLPSYAAYNNRLNKLSSVFAPLAERLMDKYNSLQSTPEQFIRLTDSMPIITCSGKREGKVALELCDKGYNASKAMYYYGVKLHGIGFYQSGKLPQMEVLQVSKASEHDLEAQRNLLEKSKGIPVFADKAFCDKTLKKQLQDNDSELLTPVKNKKGQTIQEKQRNKAADKLYSTAVSKIRQPIESFFNWLIQNTDIQRASKVRSTKGLIVHIFGRIATALIPKVIQQNNLI